MTFPSKKNVGGQRPADSDPGLHSLGRRKPGLLEGQFPHRRAGDAGVHGLGLVSCLREPVSYGVRRRDPTTMPRRPPRARPEISGTSP
jgi:hypothetical protein